MYVYTHRVLYHCDTFRDNWSYKCSLASSRFNMNLCADNDALKPSDRSNHKPQLDLLNKLQPACPPPLLPSKLQSLSTLEMWAGTCRNPTHAVLAVPVLLKSCNHGCLVSDL